MRRQSDGTWKIVVDYAFGAEGNLPPPARNDYQSRLTIRASQKLARTCYLYRYCLRFLSFSSATLKSSGVPVTFRFMKLIFCLYRYIRFHRSV